MQMTAIVIDRTGAGMLVRDESNGQEVMVLYRNPRRFNTGDRIRITYNGIMTRSLPPQITAQNIQLLSRPPIAQPVPPIGQLPRPPVAPPRPPVSPPVVIRPPIAVPPIIIPRPPVPPREMRVQVLRREQGFLIVRNLANNQILRADFPEARFFCPGSNLIIRFSAMYPGIPPRLDVVDVAPVC